MVVGLAHVVVGLVDVVVLLMHDVSVVHVVLLKVREVRIGFCRSCNQRKCFKYAAAWVANISLKQFQMKRGRREV